MKLRRAMAAAAATAVVAPLALLSAPAAFAAEGSVSSTAASSGQDKAPAPTSTTTDGTKQTPDPAQDTTQDPTHKPTKKTPLPKPQLPTEKPTKPSKPSKTGEPGEPGEPGGTAEDEDEQKPGKCKVKGGGVDPDSVLEIEFSGLPDKIVAGSGWHPFELSATNPTDEPLGEVEWSVFLKNKSKTADKQSWLGKYATLQYLDPETDTWKSVKSEKGGVAYGIIDLGAEETADIELRLNVNVKAPAGKGYAFGLGDYVDSKLDCTRESGSYEPLTISKAADQSEHPGTPKPKPTLTPTAQPSATPSATSTPAPQGTADGPVDGSLAETGSSSALPAIGLVGGAAVVVGAGAVFVVRRRKSDTAA
ncbi:LAETG motif-containing sortase-dependent surface protein [Streptomyces huasconensis]|uniref:LAETG motif-containing sortase-dependent surface protein n=1 Tax=Streptomyces huasconensis TaxID=1854574 RepID=UPI0036FCCF72